ncbi:hypothetical protein DMENIID0001_087530 [Sergentomyia squamirostris]
MKFLSVVILFSMLISSAFSLSCYLCEGANGTLCAEPEKNSESLNGIICPSNSTELECVTFAYKLGKGLLNTVRGCSPKGFCDQQDIPFFEVVHCESCTEDLCNNSIQHSGSTVVIAWIFLTTSLIFPKFY